MEKIPSGPARCLRRDFCRVTGDDHGLTCWTVRTQPRSEHQPVALWHGIVRDNNIRNSFAREPCSPKSIAEGEYLITCPAKNLRYSIGDRFIVIDNENPQ